MNIEEKRQEIQRLLQQYYQQLNYLEEEAARNGLSVPQKLVAQQNKARGIIVTLEKRLTAINGTSKHTPSGLKTPLRPPKTSAALPSIVIIDNDRHWHNIVGEVAIALKYKPQSYSIKTMLQNMDTICRAEHRVAVIGLPAPQAFTHALTVNVWTRAIVCIGKAMPIILLTTRGARPISIATRHALLRHQQNSAATLQKETFTYEWFTKTFKKAVEEGQAR